MTWNVNALLVNIMHRQHLFGLNDMGKWRDISGWKFSFQILSRMFTMLSQASLSYPICFNLGCQQQTCSAVWMFSMMSCTTKFAWGCLVSACRCGMMMPFKIPSNSSALSTFTSADTKYEDVCPTNRAGRPSLWKIHNLISNHKHQLTSKMSNKRRSCSH